MQYFTAIIALCAGMATALPAIEARGEAAICPPTVGSVLQCCATNVLGVASLNCENPASTPSSVADFKAVCGKAGLGANCCTAPVAGQALVCNAL